MDYEEYKSLVMELGYTELEARWLWLGKPEGQEATVIGVTFASKIMLSSMLKLRENPNHEENMRQRIAMANAINN